MAGRRLQDLYLYEFLFYSIAGWIIINMWQRFVENFFYNGLELNRDYPFHNFIVTFTFTGIFLFIITFVSTKLQAQDETALTNNLLVLGSAVNEGQNNNTVYRYQGVAPLSAFANNPTMGGEIGGNEAQNINQCNEYLSQFNLNWRNTAFLNERSTTTSKQHQSHSSPVVKKRQYKRRHY